MRLSHIHIYVFLKRYGIITVLGIFAFLMYLVSNESKTIEQRYDDIVYYATTSARLEITYFKNEETGECSSLIKVVADDDSPYLSGWHSVATSISCDKIPGQGENNEKD